MLNEIDQKVLATWIDFCPALKLISGADGTIHYANQSFCEFSEYTQAELRKMGWKQLSVDGDSMDADLESLKQMQSGYLQQYTVRKQYRTKGGDAKWGMLTVLRYPAIGQIEYYLCTFEPLKNGTATAFAMAMERITAMTTALDGVKTEVKTLTTMDEDAVLVNNSVRFLKRYPKLVSRLAGAILGMAFVVFGANNVVELLQRIGLLEIPVKVQQAIPVQPVGSDGQVQANLIKESQAVWTVTTPDGNRIEIPGRRDDPSWPVNLSDKL